MYLHSGCMLSCEYVCIHAGYGFLKLLFMCGNCMFEHVYWYTWPCVCVCVCGGKRMRSDVFPCHLPPNCSETGASLKPELTVLAALAHHSPSRTLHSSLCVTSIGCHIQLVMWILGIQAQICLYSKHLRTEPSLQPTYTFLIRKKNHLEYFRGYAL